jgi:hypothetical protein
MSDKMSVGEIILLFNLRLKTYNRTNFWRTSFTSYLGNELGHKPSVTLVVKQLVFMAYKTKCGLKTRLKLPKLESQTKYILCKTLIRSILPYGREYLPLLKEGWKYAPNFGKKNVKNDLRSS